LVSGLSTGEKGGGRMTAWHEDIFNNFIKLNRGFDLPEKNIVDGIYPVVASTNIKAFHKDYKIKPPAVVTGRAGSSVCPILQQMDVLSGQSRNLNKARDLLLPRLMNGGIAV
jgi:hypothetical protein